MKSLVVKTSAKMEKLEAALAEFNKQSDVYVFLNRKFKLRNFGYEELIFPKVSGKQQLRIFQALMHTLAGFKIWVECTNVTIVTKYGQEWAKNNIGARYNGSDDDDPVVKRWQNLNIDGADRLGALNHRKHRMRYDKIRWHTDGVMEEIMVIETDDEGNVVNIIPTGKFALTFDFEAHGHSECYSNYKHYRRKYFSIVWHKWDENLFGTPVPKREKKEKVVFEQTESKEDISTLTGQALFEALNPHLK